MNGTHPSLLCFGEILWDFLPAGLFPGGAPFNVAYHLHRQGADVTVVSAVGCDVLGAELRRRLTGWGLDTGGITAVADRPTGTVRATVSTRGEATYEIVADVAWDRISLPPDILARARSARGLIYGSLAQREEPNRRVLRALLTALPADAWRVFDVNLRAPFDHPALVRELATGATLLKLNAAEAARLAAGTAETPGREEADARALAAGTGCPLVCITAGDRGAGLLQENRWHWEPARKVEVADTVGSGDAFLATLVLHLLRDPNSPASALAHACRTGEWVATRHGATPEYPA